MGSGGADHRWHAIRAAISVAQVVIDDIDRGAPTGTRGTVREALGHPAICLRAPRLLREKQSKLLIGASGGDRLAPGNGPN